jgi:hypothetical protein
LISTKPRRSPDAVDRCSQNFFARRIYVTSLALGAAAQTPPQPAPALPPELLANLARLRDAALASDYAWRQVAHLTENIGPRLAGSLQAEAAVGYVADELRRLGLEVKLEERSHFRWHLSGARIGGRPRS